MKVKITRFVLGAVLWIGLLAATRVAADTHYVALGGQTPVPDYTSWATAATNIQDAVQSAASSDTVLVSNGVYQTGGSNWPSQYGNLTNRAYVNKAITLRSLNGPAVTIIKGKFHSGEPGADGTITNGPAAVRCVFMANSASLIGFTVTNGATDNASATSGTDKNTGGVYCNGSEIISESVAKVPEKTATMKRGPPPPWKTACFQQWRDAHRRVRGTFAISSSNCVIVGNSGQEYGGGVNNGTVYNSTIVGNVCLGYGGAATGSSGRYNCILKDNRAANGGGLYRGILYNCLISGNSASGYGGGVSRCTMYNCTVVSNSALGNGGGAHDCPIVCNSIVYFNTGPVNSSNWYNDDPSMTFTNSCTAPVPVALGIGGWSSGSINWVNLITNDPQFVSSAGGNYRLLKISPCINTATNFSWMADPSDARSKDLDGYRRPDRFSGQSDVGCYENIPQGTIYRFH